MRNLLVQLRAQNTAELRQIADCWGVSLTGRTDADHIAQLYRTMRDPWAVRDSIEALNAVEWAVIEALLAAGTDGDARGELPAALDRQLDEVDQAIAQLIRTWIRASEAEKLL